MPEFRDLKCPNCGASLPSEECVCTYCGSKIVREKSDAESNRRFSGNFSTPKGNYGYDFSFGGANARSRSAQDSAATTAPPPKTNSAVSSRRVIAAILAILFGSFGVQFFYLGKIGAGFASLIFFWTGIPAVIGFFQCIIWLCTTDEEWSIKYR